MAKRIYSKKTRIWKCDFCNAVNDLDDKSCRSCGASRTGGENEVNILTQYDEIETISTANETISNTKNSSAIIVVGIIVCVLLVTGILSYNAVSKSSTGANVTISTHSVSTTEDYEVKIVSKEWSYIASFEIETLHTGVTSTIKPPVNATNVVAKQVQNEKGWYNTVYTYDIITTDVVRTEKVTGNGNALPTFKECEAVSSEVLRCSEVVYCLNVISSEGTDTIVTTKDVWLSVNPEERYALSYFE